MALAEQVKRLYELYVNRPSGFTSFVPNQGKEFFNFARSLWKTNKSVEVAQK